MNPDDKSFFLDAMEDVQPLKRGPDIHWQPSRNTRARQEVDSEQLDNFLTLDFLDLLPLEEPLAFQREGVQQGVIEKLRSGKRWLTEFEEVQAFCVALPHHGGSGACYVSLRKSDEAKQENWERHAKRSR
ncbi:Smr/MutS family protein [uncultured Enterobacter sp.]|uniref:Smr/MutS family protein n=1 Tax=uncultured Enterobacter sp. TaxID=238202 RepID=UPI0025890705|nr:Smr/MutS family protein [uncultured Enterobacter sp.]